MNLQCADFWGNVGAYCHQINDNCLLVTTPLNFPDNTPVNLFVSEHDGQFTLSDDGDTLMRLHGVGLGKNPRLQSSLKRRAMQCDGDLDSGALIFRSTDLRKAYENFLKSMIEIVNYELENTALEDERLLAISEVVAALQRRNPDTAIEYDVHVIGSTGARHRFPIKAGNRLIDVTFPHHQSTGAILRKVADIEKLGAMEPLIVVDDTNNYELSVREGSLIGTFVPAMLLSTLKRESAPLDLYLSS